MLNGQNHRGSTYHVGRAVIDRIEGEKEVTEFFFPRDLDHFCLGCYRCIGDAAAVARKLSDPRPPAVGLRTRFMFRMMAMLPKKAGTTPPWRRPTGRSGAGWTAKSPGPENDPLGGGPPGSSPGGFCFPGVFFKLFFKKLLTFPLVEAVYKR